MSASYARFVSGESIALDYIPASDTNAGDVIVAGNSCLMTKRDIVANKLGSLHVGGVWEFPKAATAGSGASQGATAYWDATAHQVTPTAGTNKKIGIYAETCADGDALCKVLSIPQS